MEEDKPLESKLCPFCNSSIPSTEVCWVCNPIVFVEEKEEVSFKQLCDDVKVLNMAMDMNNKTLRMLLFQTRELRKLVRKQQVEIRDLQKRK